MSDEPSKPLRSLVDASGFVFQLAVESRIRDSLDDHGWEVFSREHPWTHAGKEGYVDLVLGRNYVRLVIECKRSRGGDWVFLIPKSNSTGTVKCHWAYRRDTAECQYGWEDFDAVPTTEQSEFCVVRGTGENDRPLLERIASGLLDPVEAIAVEEMYLRSIARHLALIHIPIIVTTARLQVCQFNAADVALTTGNLPSSAQFAEVPFIRFRKCLTGTWSSTADPKILEDVLWDQERTVFVVNADSLIDFLRDFKAGHHYIPRFAPRAVAEAFWR